MIEVFIKRNNLNSKGVYDISSGSVTVKKGSCISQTVKTHFKNTKYDNLRNSLMSKGIIQDFKFTTDYKFDKPSPASSIVLGSITNGRIEWETIDGDNLNMLRNQISQDKIMINKDKLSYILEELYKKCDQIAENKISSIQERMILRLNESEENMLEDILSLKNDIQYIKKHARDKENILLAFSKLLDDFFSNK